MHHTTELICKKKLIVSNLQRYAEITRGKEEEDNSLHAGNNYTFR